MTSIKLIKSFTAAGLIISAFILGSCTRSGGKADVARDQYRISGTVTNAKENGIIRILRIDGINILPFDSTTTDKDGKFTLTGKLPQAGPAYFLLDVYDLQRTLVALDSGNILSAVLDGKDPEGKAVFTGSTLMTNHTEVDAIRAWYEEAQTSVNATFASNKAAMSRKSFTDSLAEIARQTDIELTSRIKNQIRKMGPSVVSLYAIGNLNPEMEYEFMDSLARVFKVANRGEMQGVESYVTNLERVSKLREGAMAPAIELPTPEGTTFSLASLKGQVVLVDFWASWCGPCRRANPEVVKLYKATKDKGFTILGVSLDNDKDKWLEAIKKDGLTWHHVSDLKRWESPVAVLWQVASIPSTFLIDRTGKIVGRNLQGAELESKVNELVSK